MKDILEMIILNLVENKEAVEIKQVDGDMGRIIGKQGRLAKSIRTVMKAVALKEQKKVSVEFIG